MAELASSMSCSTLLPSAVTVARRASRSATLFSSAALAILAASSWNCSFLATKSVSQFSSTRTPASLPSSWAVTSPLAAVRSARLPASLTPFLRRFSMASSKSPSASARAFLQSIIPAPLCSRSRFTSAAEIFAMSVRSLLVVVLDVVVRVVTGRSASLYSTTAASAASASAAASSAAASAASGVCLSGGGRSDLGAVGGDRSDLGVGLGRVADRGLLDFLRSR